MRHLRYSIPFDFVWPHRAWACTVDEQGYIRVWPYGSQATSDNNREIAGCTVTINSNCDVARFSSLPLDLSFGFSTETAFR
jgi:hypothetical protein